MTISLVDFEIFVLLSQKKLPSHKQLFANNHFAFNRLIVAAVINQLPTIKLITKYFDNRLIVLK